MRRSISMEDKPLVEEVLRRAGFPGKGSVAFVFWADKFERELAQLEKDYLVKRHPGHKEEDIIQTVFEVLEYDFFVEQMMVVGD